MNSSSKNNNNNKRINDMTSYYSFGSTYFHPQ